LKNSKDSQNFQFSVPQSLATATRTFK